MPEIDPTPVIVEELARLLREQHMTITTIESCTGGLVAAALTNLPGISDVFPGGFVTYSDPLKQHMVGVQRSTLEAHGAVSADTAIEMAIGGAINADASIAIAITGIAGPNGGSAEKPVGTVWICIAQRAADHASELDDVLSETQVDAEIDCRRFVFDGDRSVIRSQSVIAALSMAIQMLNHDLRDLPDQHERLGA